MADPLSLSLEKVVDVDNEDASSRGVDTKIELTTAEYQKVLRKLDWHILPIVSLLYLLSFLDRSNIGNAKIAGMTKDLNLLGLKYNIAAAVFFIPYCLAEVPSNITLRLVRPSRWIPTIMVLWGLTMTLMCLVNSFEGLLAARLVLGLTEAGLFPGITYYLSLWYPRDKQAVRVAIFFSAATVAGAFGGILAYGIEKMEGIGRLHGWQWIFCLEGLATVIVALTAYLCLPDYPETARFLTEIERSHVIRKLKEDSRYLSTRFDRKFIWQALGDYKTFVQMFTYTGVLIPVYAIALFTPTIIKELGYSASHAQLLTIPPFAAGCLATIVIGVYSDQYKLRGPFVVGCCMIALVGYIVLDTQVKPRVAYFGAVLAAMGVFPTIAVILAWAGGNAGGTLKRGVVIAVVIGVSNLGGICSSFVYFNPPRFHAGHGTMMGCLSMTIILTCFSMWNYNRLNLQKQAQCAVEGIYGDNEGRYADMGDDSPLFRYLI